jgi:DNA-binding transcriptional regulator YhcF (GntR family)
MSEAETLYSARQLADELEITLQMLSKYAQAYTKLTKQQISKKGRDGRHFTGEQREVIKNAREMVRSNTGVTVEDAIKRALIFDLEPLEVETWGGSLGIDLERLKTALSESVTAPIVTEMQTLRTEIAALRAENRQRVEISTTKKDDEYKHGLLVRLAMRIETIFRN